MQLASQLQNDSLYIYDLELSQVRLIPDAENTWFLLIPRQENIIEWIDLDLGDQIQLTKEIDFVSRLVRDQTRPDKLNIASLGNLVPQLHIHIIARYKNDRAWPNPIWGTQSTQSFNHNLVQKWQDLFDQS
ncbi:MAG: hypothetical protein CME66_10330 [Halobacteriovoraceae bacterium]|nr:hypothetical protein [Halobacteriovoraceae bacterium]|tara:strand:+ start:45 stop:437 length:393 start_codon:yes stop_codon:yes gene_type:complete